MNSFYWQILVAIFLASAPLSSALPQKLLEETSLFQLLKSNLPAEQSRSYSFKLDYPRLKKTLEIAGPLQRSIIPFSDGPALSNLKNPRILLSPSPKIFLSLIIRDEKPWDVEFITWANNKFLFGVIENFYPTNKGWVTLKVIDKARCVECHKTGGPIFAEGPWINATGANHPYALFTSFALLETWKAKFPSFEKAYQEWQKEPSLAQTEYGSLSPEAKPLFEKIQFYDLPLFDFRGSEGFDVNMVQGHMLLKSYQIRDSLRLNERVAYEKDFVERLLLANLFRNDASVLFNWNEHLETTMKKSLNDLPLTSQRSPFLRNYNPVVKHEEIRNAAGITAHLLKTDPIKAIKLFSAYVEKDNRHPFPNEELASSERNFAPLRARFNSNSAKTALSLIYGITEDDLSAIKKKLRTKQDVKDYFNSPAWAKVFTEGEMLNRSHLLDGLNVEDNENPAHACLNCHRENRIPFAFDPLKIAQWKEYLEDAKVGEALKSTEKKRAKVIAQRLLKKTMPPEDSEERKKFSYDSQDIKALLQYLNSL